ncbi:hypothetical protein BO79DRAFT_267544 [Aspergillus costaricaensis CBS 115574]|uniref:Uncharacterized protein n=1 Tax=Aspergillus costaricaensis CBS 115574 TaxID=1448317 RepID=A0ACD1ISM2_9EURO|nr:hypothetical protein BO79DRAFT_267544 [Aspergillus costaricaensis CBS 115574]RAK93411.1 hypothetical protein BO79DRAFT_267544 [Aspergillus costaricaensis CBS 115574]
MADDASVKIVDESTIQNASNRNFARPFILSLKQTTSSARLMRSIIFHEQKSTIPSEGFNNSRVKPILASAITCSPANDIWEYVNDAAEIGSLYVGIPQFHSVSFGCVQDSAFLPPTKRPHLSSPNNTFKKLPNRIHRRVILRDYGKPIYTARSESKKIFLPQWQTVGFVFNDEDFLRWADGRWKIWGCMSG